MIRHSEKLKKDIAPLLKAMSDFSEQSVLVDLLDLYRQICVDVFARLREFNKARNLGPIMIPSGGA